MITGANRSRFRRRSERGRRLAGVRWRRDRVQRELDPPELAWEDQVAYAKLSRKGNPICEHYVFHGGRVRRLLIRWSLRGRVNQWDALVDGVLRKTCGKRRMLELWPCLSYLG